MTTSAPCAWQATPNDPSACGCRPKPGRPRAARPPAAGSASPTRQAGFTLVELLTVVAIISLLIGLLLPTLSATKEAARSATCLSNVRQLATATNAYANSHDMMTPAGSYNNASGISPKAQKAPPRTRITGGSFAGMTVWDSIGSLLEPYLDADRKEVYRCPSAFRTSDNSYEIAGDDPYSGTDPDDVFKPNYFYMSTALWINLAPNTSWYPQVWATRNIANVRLGTLPVGESQAVAWVDESTSHHTGSTDIYGRNAAGERAKDVSNFGYLDGHAESRTFDTLRGYLEQLPPPIRQRQFNIDFRGTAAWQVAEDLPEFK